MFVVRSSELPQHVVCNLGHVSTGTCQPGVVETDDFWLGGREGLDDFCLSIPQCILYNINTKMDKYNGANTLCILGMQAYICICFGITFEG